MKYLNQHQLIGCLGADPEFQEISTGFFARFSVATTRSWKDELGEIQEHTDWHSCCAFGNLATRVRDYMHKGSRVYLSGYLKSNTYEDREGISRTSKDTVAQELIFLDSKERG